MDGGISLAAISTAATVVGGVVSTISQMQASSYQMAVAERNAQIADQNAPREADTAQVESRDWGESARMQFGALMSDLAASGVGTMGGSSSLLQTGTRRLIRRDAERIREEGTDRIRAQQQQAADFRGQADMARRERGFNLFGGALNVTSSYISSATRNRRRSALLEAG